MPQGAAGIVKPQVGEPDDLLLDFIEKGRRVTEGTTVVTSGFKSSREGVESLFPRGIPIGRVTEGTTVVTSGFTSSRDGVESLFPRGIPIGRVTEVDLDEVDLYQRVHLKPFADLRRIDYVQVLTARGETERAQVPAP